ncbi:MAG: Gfo/Idh/MocA family protein [Promethearchaeota archaeon]
MKVIKWGLIGCGDIANKRVAPALVNLSNSKLIAVARYNPNLVQSFAEKFGVKKRYKKWQDLIKDEEIDAVYIATPVYLHAPMTIAACENGKHVLCEKPMALNSEECRNMIRAADKNGVKLGISYYRRFYPLINRIKELIKNGEIGEPTLAQLNVFSYAPIDPDGKRGWFINPQQAGGGPMKDVATHRIEVLLNLFGEPAKITSHLSQLYFERKVEDTGFVGIEFKKRILGIITVTHTSFEKKDTLDIYGTRGSLHVPVLNSELLIINNEQGLREEQWPCAKNLHQPLITNFIESVLNDKQPVVDGKVGIEVCMIEDEIYKDFESIF